MWHELCEEDAASPRGSLLVNTLPEANAKQLPHSLRPVYWGPGEAVFQGDNCTLNKTIFYHQIGVIALRGATIIPPGEDSGGLFGQVKSRAPN